MDQQLGKENSGMRRHQDGRWQAVPEMAVITI
jgi:hypothetical protein